MSANAIERLREAIYLKPPRNGLERDHDDYDWAVEQALAALAAVETLLEAAKRIADAHESGEGFQWVGSEDDTEDLDRIAAAVRRVESGQ